ADDFNTGVKYGLDIYAPIGPAGHFLDTVELFGGRRVFDANPMVEEALEERGRLWHRESFSHQYPHCWRCHNPVIFLATSQWFIAMDGVRLKADTTGAAGNTVTEAAANTGSVRLQPDSARGSSERERASEGERGWGPASSDKGMTLRE